MMKTLQKFALTFAVVVLAASYVSAGTINLNDVYNGGMAFMSNNHMWLDVVETNGAPNDPAINFYQDPLAVGDQLIVNPTNFRVEINPGPGLDQIDSQLEMIIMGKDLGNGNVATIPQLSFMEDGDFNVFGDPDAFVSAEVNYFWQVLEGPAAGTSNSGTVSFTAGANDSGLWNLMFDEVIPDGTTKLRFEFDNRLTGFAPDDLSLAFIAKKQIPGIKITIPEPSSMFLMLGLVGCLSLARRKS